MRLDKLLAQNQISRKEMKQALFQQNILVDSLPARKLSQNVDTGLQVISLHGQPITAPPHRYYLLHKPAGIVTANQDQKHQTVMDMLQPYDYNPNLYAIGRLDRDTTGLLLLTDNGPLGFQLLHPSYHVQKTYQVVVNGQLEESAIQAFATGVTFHDGTQCKPAKLVIHTSNPTCSTASLTISEGKFHQVKKMFLTVGVKVTSLTRTQFGEFRLDPDLPAGNYRPLNAQELAIIKSYLEKTRSIFL